MKFVTNSAQTEVEVDSTRIMADGSGRVVGLWIYVTWAPGSDILLGVRTDYVAVLRHG